MAALLSENRPQDNGGLPVRLLTYLGELLVLSMAAARFSIAAGDECHHVDPSIGMDRGRAAVTMKSHMVGSAALRRGDDFPRADTIPIDRYSNKNIKSRGDGRVG
jgi:hypothetical protein